MTQPIDTAPSPHALAVMLLGIIYQDRDRLERIDKYVLGEHDSPYMPHGADAEYQLLVERSVSNWMPLLLGTPAQALYVDAFRRGEVAEGDDLDLTHVEPEWKHWQESRLDAKQIPIHKGALKYGHSFALTERIGEKVLTKGLSALRTSAVYEDPANDVDPWAALHVIREPNSSGKTKTDKRGRAYMWDHTTKYLVTFESYTDSKKIRVEPIGPHGGTQCPVTRFVASIDLEGRTLGVIEPAIPIQNRVNQTILDLLVAQTYGSFKIRTVTGMAPPIKRWTQKQIDDSAQVYVPSGVATPPAGVEAGDPIVDPETGKPVPEAINMNAKRFLWAEDHETEFGSLDETNLEGYIKSLDMSIRHLSAITQTPPHYLLGQIANLSADALQAAETALLRKVEEYKKSFGESWERVFRVAMELTSDTGQADDYAGEVVWRNTEMKSLSATADALAKLKELEIPVEGLMEMVPGATRNIILKWIKGRNDRLEKVRASGVTEGELWFDEPKQPAPQPGLAA